MTALLNYTTTVAVDKTLGEITRLLSSHGANRVTIDYDGEGLPSAVAFVITTAIGEQEFRLPANLAGVWRILTKQYEGGRVARRFTSKEQAARVGWRIIKDWLEAQAAIIEAGMVSMDEVMLPYLIAPTGQTVYEEYRQSRLVLPARGESR